MSGLFSEVIIAIDFGIVMLAISVMTLLQGIRQKTCRR